ncbi:MAG: class I SAM-dependent methyltransferase [Chloroflexi bacterium]|nr:class I SAM-dependent methyltransferase [Chloroflexota bacterium]
MTQAATEENVQGQLASERREPLDVHRIMSLVPLRPYMAVADIGCGTGLFTIPLAKFLWDGKVYAVDWEEGVMEALRKRVAEVHLGNVVAIKADGATLPLEPNSMEGVVLSWVLHKASDRGELMRQVVAALRRAGWCAVIDWRPDAAEADGPPKEKRIGEEEVGRLGSEAGLRVSLRRELSDQYYLMVLTK